MPNLILLFLQYILAPMLLVGFFIVVLFAMAGMDGLPLAKALLVVFLNVVVSICAWSVRVLLTLLTLLVPSLSPILQPGCSKSKGKSK